MGSFTRWGEIVQQAPIRCLIWTLGAVTSSLKIRRSGAYDIAGAVVLMASMLLPVSIAPETVDRYRKRRHQSLSQREEFMLLLRLNG